MPSAEQKQSGIVHWFVSHSGARFGSVSTAIKIRIERKEWFHIFFQFFR